MVIKNYIPNRGDLVWVDFGSSRGGHEQAGKRPALVISPSYYNGRSGMVLVCPITSQSKSYIFEVPLNNSQIKGAVLSDQIRAFSWRERGIEFIDSCEAETVIAVQEKLLALIQ